MKRIFVISITSILCGCAGMSSAPSASSGASGTAGTSAAPGVPVAGKVPLGATVIQMEAVVLGWSARKELLDKTVVNEQNEQIGRIIDIIITPENSVSFAVINVGGFLGIARHDVAIPMEQLRMLKDGTLVLPGATREALKALPPFQYMRR